MYMKTVLIALLIGVSAALLVDAATPQSAAVGSGSGIGQPVNIGEFPFIVILTSQDRVFWPVLATIVNEWFILTSGFDAHYILKYNLTEHVVARAGSTKLEECQIHSLGKVIVHKKYDTSQKSFEYNIGLIKLATPLTFGSTVAPAKFAPKGLDIKKGTEVTFIEAFEIRNEIEVKRYIGSYLKTKDCQRSYTIEPWNTITRREFCVLVEDNQHHSVMNGKPLVLNETVLGFSLLYMSNEFGPDIYLKVSHYRKWINRQIAQNP